MRRTLLVLAVALTGVTVQADAQDPRDLAVKTFKLRNLRPDDAAKLLGPYVNTPGGGVFEAGSIGAITVRETFSMMAVIDSILREHDKPRAVVTLRFQLIAALDSSRRDPALSAIDAELRKLFKFDGYQLIGEGTATTEEGTEFTMSLSAGIMLDNRAFGEQYLIQGWLERVDAGTDTTVRLNLSLRDGTRGRDASDLLRTGLTMPIGQGVILGSATPPNRVGSRVALILVVQPELAARSRK